MILLQHLRQLHADMLGSEGNDGCGATERGGGGGALERIGVHDAGGRELLDMAMTVDAAGKYEFAAGVNLALGGAESAADRGNGLARDSNISLERIRGGGDAPSPDDQVV